MGGVGSGAKPRDYPVDLVMKIRSLYESGQTIKEIQTQVTGCKVQNVIKRYGISTRRAIKREQSGEANHMWKGSQAGYQALHMRVEAARGKPMYCDWCGDDAPGRYEWANLTGRYDEVTDFDRLCTKCHRTFDAERRRLTGRRTTEGWR